MHLRPSVLGFSVCFSFVSLVFFFLFFTYTVEKKRNNGVFEKMDGTCNQYQNYPRLGTGTVTQLLGSFTTIPEALGSISGIAMATQNQLKL